METIRQAVEHNKLSDVILVDVWSLVLFFWLRLADSTRLTAVWCSSPYFMTFLADSEIADQIPEIWRRKAPPPSNGKPVKVYRGFARNVQRHAAAVIRSDEIGDILSRDPAAASDAFFNRYGRDPLVSGAEQGGVVEITVPAN
jgi:hypothetical protein